MSGSPQATSRGHKGHPEGPSGESRQSRRHPLRGAGLYLGGRYRQRSEIDRRRESQGHGAELVQISFVQPALCESEVQRADEREGPARFRSLIADEIQWAAPRRAATEALSQGRQTAAENLPD